MKHCMIDLETMGLSPGCAILSIGAVGFDENGLTGEEFKRNVDIQSCLRHGLRIDPETEKWWSQQSTEARAALYDPLPVELLIALDDFSAWYAQNQFERVWSHGAATDVPWLQAAFDAVGERVPWHYRDIRDTRTLYDVAPHVGEYSAEVEHDALEDARVQAKMVVSARGAVRAAMEVTL